jgi:hypothetical protein
MQKVLSTEVTTCRRSADPPFRLEGPSRNLVGKVGVESLGSRSGVCDRVLFGLNLRLNPGGFMPFKDPLCHSMTATAVNHL